jgi:hypothetical protein
MAKHEGRGLGPFSGGQLTIVIVAIAAVFAVPTAALAASGAFTSNSTAPALTATNRAKTDGAVAIYGKQVGVGRKVRFGVRGAANGKGGVGVEGLGSKYGVFSNGPFAVTGDATINGNLQITAGKSFTCGGCVAPKTLSSASRAVQPLAPGESQSGVFNAADNYTPAAPQLLETSLNFVRMVSGTLTYNVILAAGAKTANCPEAGKAARGFVCVYDNADQDVSAGSGFAISRFGGGVQWSEVGGGFAVARGTYTVTAR